MNRWMENHGLGVALILGALAMIASLPLSNPLYLVVGAVLVVVATAGNRIRSVEAGIQGLKAQWWRDSATSLRGKASSEISIGVPTPITVHGPDAEVLERVADALDANPPETPDRFAQAFAQAVASVIAQPTLYPSGERLLGGNIVVTEERPGGIVEGPITISIVTPAVTFSGPPIASINASDLKLAQPEEPVRFPSAAASGHVSPDRRQASWNVFSRSTASRASITLSSIQYDLSSDAPPGPLELSVEVGGTVRSVVNGMVIAKPKSEIQVLR